MSPIIKNNIRFIGRSVYTNMPVSGAYRGYGATQGFFAWECLVDMMADKIGTKEKLKRAKEIKRELDTALRLNPNDETALSMLGSYYREAAKIGWFKRMVGNAFLGEVPKGDFTLAEKAFRKAISHDSRIIRNYHELALICIDSGNKEEAIVLMKTALEKPILFETDKIRIEEMRALLKKLTNE